MLSFYLVLFSFLFSALAVRQGDVNHVFSEEELSAFKGEDGDTVYLSIFGEVYDVTNGTEFYGKGRGYHFFAGRDATASFITGNFTDAAAIEKSDILALRDVEIDALEKWRAFYEEHEVYEFKGLLNGEFYDSTGEPTQYLKDIRARMSDTFDEKEDQEEQDL